MGKFDKSRLSGLNKSLSLSTLRSDQLSSDTETNSNTTTDLRLKLAKKNQVLDARHILNKKKQNNFQKQTIKQQINNYTESNNDIKMTKSLSGGSLLIMKTIDEDSGSEKRLYKVINNYNELEKKNHIVFANSKNTLITVNNDKKNQSLSVEPIIKKTIKNYLKIDDEVEEDLNDDDDDDDNLNVNSVNLFKKRDFNMKKIFDINENFKIKIDNPQVKKEQKSVDESMDVDVMDSSKFEDDTVQSPIQGYRLLVSNLHQNVTEDDILELFSAIGPIKRAKFIRKGTADVVFVRLDDARNAITSYNNKLLDGRELKIELVSKVPISEKLTQPAQVNNYQFIKNNTIANQQQIFKPTQQTALPQRVRNINNQSINEQLVLKTNSDSLSKRFSSINTSASNNTIINNNNNNNLQQEQEKTILPKPNMATSKISVDTTVIHQALFTNSKANTNPVTFTVKI